MQTVVNYPTALPFLPAYARYRATPADFPNVHRNQSRILSLPMFAEMSEAQVAHTVDAIRAFCTPAERRLEA